MALFASTVLSFLLADKEVRYDNNPETSKLGKVAVFCFVYDYNPIWTPGSAKGDAILSGAGYEFC